ncbi:hypothetical protein ACFL6H_01415 [Candidatus Latescibacterota bacterium]
MYQYATFRTILLLMIMVIVIFSCSDSGNQMEKTRNAIGEPDDKIVEDWGTFKTEIWVYARYDYNFVYRFEKTASNCGGSSDWLLSPYRSFADYHYGYELYNPPPIITHTPIESSAPLEAITIRAKVELHEQVKNLRTNKYVNQDEEIIEVNLAYRASTDSLFEKIIMSIVDSLYVEDIPSDVVTTAGVDYYIEARSDESSWRKFSHLPQKEDYYTIVVSDSLAAVTKAGNTDSSEDVYDNISPIDPGAIPERFSPISP